MNVTRFNANIAASQSRVWTRSFRGGQPVVEVAHNHERRPENDDGPSVCKPRPTIVRIHYLRRLRNNPSTPHTYTTNAEDLKDAWRKHFDGAVTVHRQECLGYRARSAGTSRPRAVNRDVLWRCAIWRAARPTRTHAPIALHECRRYKCTA